VEDVDDGASLADFVVIADLRNRIGAQLPFEAVRKERALARVVDSDYADALMNSLNHRCGRAILGNVRFPVKGQPDRPVAGKCYTDAMCGRYSLTFDERFFARFDTVNMIQLGLHYNVAPSQIMPTIVRRSPNQVVPMVWGFVPPWEKGEKVKTLINLRDDTVLTRGWAKRYVQTQRCLVPATGFFEWQKSGTSGKIPYFIHLKTGDYFAFAGLFSTYTAPNGRQADTFAILTTQPNALMASIHNRMPVILSKEEEDEWLNPDIVELEQLKAFLDPYPDDEMEAYPVSTRVNYPGNNTPEVLIPQREGR
jgi:putative SOS response-associated peptidase YedK